MTSITGYTQDQIDFAALQKHYRIPLESEFWGFYIKNHHLPVEK